MHTRLLKPLALLAFTVTALWAPLAQAAFFQTWQVGIDNGNNSEFANEGAVDDDWYFAGTYPAPVGVVAADDPFNTFERALTNSDPFTHIHFNLAPNQLDDLFRINVDVVQSNFGGGTGTGNIPFDISMNGVPLYSAVLTSDGLQTTPVFSGAFAGATTGENIVTLNRGPGGGWMQFDYIRLSNEPAAISDPLIFGQEWQVGIDNGTQSEFVQENGSANPPPGLPALRDDDWYFAGTYPAPIGSLIADSPTNTFERALTTTDPEDRIHFNLAPDQYDDFFFIDVDVVSSTFSGGPIPFDILFNDVLLYSAVLSADGLHTTPLFSGLDVGALTGDNVITLRRGGNGGWMQFDYIRLNSAEYHIPEPATLALLGLGALALRRRKR